MGKVMQLYAECERLKASGLKSLHRHCQRCLRHQEQELRELRSKKEKGVCILCGSVEREDEYR